MSVACKALPHHGQNSRTITMDLYIYYRVRASDADAFQQKAAAMQRELQRHGAVATALKRRPDAQDGMHTWMEVYLAATPDFEPRLAEAVTASGLQTFIEGQRHTEQFVDLSSCA
jgi:hypothetical protein